MRGENCRLLQRAQQGFRYHSPSSAHSRKPSSGKNQGQQLPNKDKRANVEVSWQVTGIRQDAYATSTVIQTEEQKIEQERGFYLYPTCTNQPEERGSSGRASGDDAADEGSALKQLEESKQKSQSIIVERQTPNTTL